MLGLKRILALIGLATLRLGVPVLGIWLLCVVLRRTLGNQQHVEWPAQADYETARVRVVEKGMHSLKLK